MLFFWSVYVFLTATWLYLPKATCLRIKIDWIAWWSQNNGRCGIWRDAQVVDLADGTLACGDHLMDPGSFKIRLSRSVVTCCDTMQRRPAVPSWSGCLVTLLIISLLVGISAIPFPGMYASFNMVIENVWTDLLCGTLAPWHVPNSFSFGI